MQVVILQQNQLKVSYRHLMKMKKKISMFPLDSKKRFEWSNLPAGIVDRAGISIGELSDLQRKLLFDFFSIVTWKIGI